MAFEAALSSDAQSEPKSTVITTERVSARCGSGLWAEPQAQTAPEMIPNRGGRRVNGRARATKCFKRSVVSALAAEGSRRSAKYGREPTTLRAGAVSRQSKLPLARLAKRPPREAATSGGRRTFCYTCARCTQAMLCAAANDTLPERCADVD